MKSPHVYQSLSEVPQSWRKLKGGRLSLEQINTIVGRAYALSQGGNPVYGAAQQEFMSQNKLHNGLWVRS